MTDNKATEAMLDKIAKLMAKAKGTTNENEAAIFMAKAQELLAEHNLSEAMLAARDQTMEQGPVGRHVYEKRVPDAWRERIIMGVAKVYFCGVLCKSGRGRSQKGGYTFVGREHNARVAVAMADYLIATVKRMAREFSPDRVTQGNFRKGAGDRLYERLMAIYYERKQAEAPVAKGDGTSLAIYNHEEKAIAEAMGPTTSARAKGNKTMGYGAGAGRAAGDSISLNTQIRETRSSRMIAG